MLYQYRIDSGNQPPCNRSRTPGVVLGLTDQIGHIVANQKVRAGQKSNRGLIGHPHKICLQSPGLLGEYPVAMYKMVVQWDTHVVVAWVLRQRWQLGSIAHQNPVLVD